MIMRDRRTLLLALIAVLAGAAAIAGYVRLDHTRSDALASERDLSAVRRDLAEVMAASGSAGVAMGKMNDSEVDRRLRQAAAVAGLSEKLRSTTAGNAARIGTTDYSELPVFLRFESVTLQQLMVFLRELAVDDPGSRTKSIELSPPDLAAQAAAVGPEVWTADLTVAYLLFAPAESKGR